MRQETITKTYLKFNELSPEQKQKVLDKNRHYNTDFDWFEESIGEFKTKLEKLGFYDVKVEFSGFSSQGDGASFTAKHDKRGEVYRIGRSYSHSNTITSDNEVTKLVARKLSDELYRDLEKEYNYLQSDESIAEILDINEYEFDIDTLDTV